MKRSTLRAAHLWHERHVQTLEARTLLSVTAPVAIESVAVETWTPPAEEIPQFDLNARWKVVAADDPSRHVVPTGAGYDGVVELVVTTFLNTEVKGSATLLPSGKHLLTAAHVVTNDSGQFNVTELIAYFDLPGQVVAIPATGVYIHPEYDGTFFHGADIAIVELAEMAPAAAERYDIYRGTDELGKTIFFTGYGNTGVGATGDLLSANGQKHSGSNRYEALSEIFSGTIYPPFAVRPGSTLVYDFDSGFPRNDALGIEFGIHNLGLGPSLEASTSFGDSGGPSFINGKIAGVASYIAGGPGSYDASPGTNASFGDFSVDTRVSAFAGWIDSIVNFPPVLAPIPAQSVNQGRTLSFVASASDPNPSTSLTYSLAPGAPAGSSIDASSGQFNWTTNESTPLGPHTITVLVSDNWSPTLADSKTFTVTVNPPGPGEISVSYQTDPNRPGKYIFTFSEGLAGTNALELRANALGQLEYSHNGGPFVADLDPVAGGNQAFLLSTISRVNVNLGIGNDTLTVSNQGPGGLIVNADDGIVFNGGTGVANLLRVFGTSGHDSFAVGLNNVQIAGRTVRASNVDVYELNSFGGNDTLTVETVSEEADYVEAVGSRVDVRRGPNPLAASRLVINHVEFEQLGIRTAGGNDTIAVRQPTSGTLRPSVSVLSQEGIDRIEFELAPATVGITHFVDAGPGGEDRLNIFTRSAQADRVQATGTNVAVQLGPNPDAAPTINLQYTSVEILGLLTAGGADTISVVQPQVVPFPSIVAIEAQEGDDVIELEWALPGAGHLFGVNAGEGQDRLRVFTRSEAADIVAVTGTSLALKLGPAGATKTTNYTSIETLNLLTAGGNDSITLQMPAVGTFPATVGVEAAAGDDSITILFGGSTLPTAFGINGGAAGNDSLAIHNGSGYEDVVTATATLVRAKLGPNPSAATEKTISYSNLEALSLYGAGGRDSITVMEPATGAMPAAVRIEGQDGNDLISVELGSPTAATSYNIVGGDGSEDRLTVFTRSGQADRVQATGTNVAVQLGPNPDAAPTINLQYTSVEILGLLTAGGADTISVVQPQVVPFPSIVAIEAQEGDDVIELEWALPGAGHLFGVNAGEGQDRLRVFTRSEAADIVAVTGTSLALKLGPAGATKTTNYTSIETLNLLTAGGNDSITLQMPAVGTFPATVGVEAAAGDDSITILFGGSTLPTAFGINGGAAGNDSLAIHNGSGYEDVVTATATLVRAKLGPNPSAATEKTISYSNLEALSLYGAGGRDSITVMEPATGAMPAAVRIEGQDGNDLISVELGSPTAATSYNIVGGTGVDNRLSVYTRSDAADLVNGTSTTLAVQLGPDAGLQPAKNFAYAEINELTLWSAGGDDSITFDLDKGVSTLASVVVEGQAGNDVIGLIMGTGLFAHTLRPGDDAGDRFVLNTDSVEDDLVDVTGAVVEVRRGPVPNNSPVESFGYVDFELVEVITGGGNDHVRVLQPTAAAAVTIRTDEGDDTIEIPLGASGLPDVVEVDGGTGAADKLVVTDAPNRDAEIVFAATASLGVIGVTQIELIEAYGEDGQDRLVNNTAIPSSLHGGLGNDTLIGGSAADSLYGDPDPNAGAGGNDILVGREGSDLLQAGAGRDLLIGGLDDDTLEGGSDDDLLIAGSFTLEGDLEALADLHAEWTSGDDYATRIAHLTGATPGGLNDTTILSTTPSDPATVLDDGSVDTLIGGSELDWFWYTFAEDDASDVEASEELVDTAP